MISSTAFELVVTQPSPQDDLAAIADALLRQEPIPAELAMRIACQEALPSHALDGLENYEPLIAPLADDTEIPEAEREVAGRLEQLLCERDPQYTYLHGVRVSALAVQIGQQLGCDAVKLRSLKVGGRLHDLGKVIDPKILQAVYDSGTSPALFAQLKRHPQCGYDFVANLKFLSDAVKAIIAGHHAFKSSPYQADVQTGHEYTIPEHELLVQIVAVADMYDALCSTRPYRAESDGDFTPESALAIIRNDLNVSDGIINALDMLVSRNRQRKLAAAELGSAACQSTITNAA